MKDRMILLSSIYTLVLFSMLLFARTTQAANYLYSCNMSFTAVGKSVLIIGGHTHAKGEGYISCYNYERGKTEIIPIFVSVEGIGLGLGITGFNINGAALNIGIKKRPESLLGKYVKLEAHGAIGAGAGAGVGGRLSFNNGVAVLNVGFSGRSGIGVGVELLSIVLTRRDEGFEYQHKYGNPSGLTHNDNCKEAVALHELKQKIEEDKRRQHESQYNDIKYINSNRKHKAIRVENGDVIDLVDDNGKFLKRIVIDNMKKPRY